MSSTTARSVTAVPSMYSRRSERMPSSGRRSARRDAPVRSSVSRCSSAESGPRSVTFVLHSLSFTRCFAPASAAISPTRVFARSIDAMPRQRGRGGRRSGTCSRWSTMSVIVVGISTPQYDSGSAMTSMPGSIARTASMPVARAQRTRASRPPSSSTTASVQANRRLSSSPKSSGSRETSEISPVAGTASSGCSINLRPSMRLYDVDFQRSTSPASDM